LIPTIFEPEFLGYGIEKSGQRIPD